VKTFKITLGVLGVLLVIFIAGLFFLADYLDKHQDLLVSTASEALGREVRIEKGVTMHWSMTPSIALDGVWVANPEWASGEYLARAERAVLQFDLASLLMRRLELRQISLVKADIRLESGSQGRQNWAFGDKTSTALALQIDRLKCVDSHLYYRPLAGPERQLAIPDLELVGFGGADISLKARLDYRDFPVSLSATARPDPADRSGRLDLKNIKIQVGSIDVAGEMQIPLHQGGRLEGTLTSDSLDLTPFLAIRDRDVADIRALLAWELDADALHYPDAALRLEAGRLRVKGIGFDDVTLDASLVSDHLKLQIADGAKNLDIALDLKPEAPGWRLHVRNSSKLDLGSLIESEKTQDARSVAPVVLDIDLSGRGRSLGAVLGSANGQLGMVVGAGHFSKEVSDRLPLGSVLDSLIGAIDAKRKTESRSQLECAVLHLDVVDGIATSRKGLALRTESLNVLGGGAIKLDTGEIDLHFKTAQRKGLGISILGLADDFIRLSGTLRQPRVEVNAVGTLTQGGAVWATGGLSLLSDSLFRRLTASSNPCESVMKADASQQD